MAESQRKRISRDYAQMYVALRRITSYQSPERMRRSSRKDWGVDTGEAIEMAYENVIQEAKIGLKGIYKPKPATPNGG